MSNAGQKRLVWFDANRVFAAIGVVLIHSSTDFGGKPFLDATTSERLAPVFFRSLGEFSGSEMFFLFSLFMIAMRVDKGIPSYGSAVSAQAKRLLVPFAFWVIFYAFFRLIKADAFNYSSHIWNEITQVRSWLGYFTLGKVQYHMHFLPTLFVLFLFYPLMRVAMRYPLLGFTLVLTLGIMNNTQGFIWGLGLEPELRDYFLRALKIIGYVGYGFAAFALYGVWKDGIPRGESRLLLRLGTYFALLAYVATLPFFATAVQNGNWGVRAGWDYYGHFLMPVCIFLIFMGTQYTDWSEKWSNRAKYTFGVYLVHPAVIDLFDICILKSGVSEVLEPWSLVLLRFVVVLPTSFLVAYGISKVSAMAWTVGLGPTPWETRSMRLAKA
jgi:surface polysaccharide O-acyltransferase-like enzyme